MEGAESSRMAAAAAAEELAQLDEEGRLKDEFLGKLVHELGNHFLPYQFALQLLRHADDGTSTVEQVRSMLEEHGHSVDQFMSDLRVVSRLARGILHAERKPLDVTLLVQRSLTKVQPRIDQYTLTLRPDLPAEPIGLQGDRALLERCVDHLLDNAVKFTPREGQIWFTLKRDDDQIVLRVRDSGLGIAPHDLPRVFRLFFQVDPATAGWGAGLAVVRAVAELHGGHVDAFSPGLGQGSEFVVRLPAA